MWGSRRRGGVGSDGAGVATDAGEMVGGSCAGGAGGCRRGEKVSLCERVALGDLTGSEARARGCGKAVASRRLGDRRRPVPGRRPDSDPAAHWGRARAG